VVNNESQFAKDMGFEEIKHGEAYLEERKQQQMQEQQLQNFEDVGTDSFYPLVTTDPKISKEYTVKINGQYEDKLITDQKLYDVFDDKGNKNVF